MFQHKADSAPDSAQPSKVSSTSEPLSAESERLLGGVPDHIGGNGAAADPPDAAGNRIAAMVDSLVIKPEHVDVLIEGLFKGASWFFDSDHWLVSPLEARVLSQPGAEMLNYIWLSHRDEISNRFVEWMLSTPGALGLIMGGGIILGPRIVQQVKVSRERRPAVSVPRQPAPDAPQTRPAPRPVPRAGETTGGN
jgi:hypothetical protein